MKLAAVYGTLRRNQGNHRILADSEFIKEERTEPVWELFNLGGFPGIRSGKQSITIELYKVDERTERRLDMLEGYSEDRENNFYDKEKIQTSEGEAIIYTLQGEAYIPHTIIPSGDWLQR